MKNTIRRAIGILGLALMGTQLIGTTATASTNPQRSSAAFEQAAPLTPAQKEIEGLFRQISTHAVAVSTHADRLESFTHSRLHRETHAAELNKTKDAINTLGADFRKLEALRSAALPWQVLVMDRLKPVLIGLAGHATDAIDLMNANRSAIPPAEYRAAVRNLCDAANHARNVIAVNLEYAQAREKLNRLDAFTVQPVVTASVQPLVTLKPLAEKVRSELMTLPYYGVFDHLAFQIDGGRITLTGDVTQPVLKSAAENVVTRIEGVTAVENRINVLPLSSNDDRIRIAAYWAIYGHSALAPYSLNPQPPIRIIVENGNITLKGVVRSEMDRSIAYMQANSVPGAFSVGSQLQIGL